MMYYLLDENKKITAYSPTKFDKNCLETDKNIIVGCNGKIIFEEETQTDEYLQQIESIKKEEIRQQRIAEISIQLKKFDEDKTQHDVGRVFTDWNERVANFVSLHNELRVLEGKPEAEYKIPSEEVNITTEGINIDGL